MINKTTQTFGDYLRDLRVHRDISMRSLAKELNMDVGNLSKIENGKMKPPMKEQFIEDISDILKLSKGEKEKLIDISSHESGEYPRDIKEMLKDHSYIPVLLRTISNKKLSDEEIRKLTEKLNK
jgi:transcriptional regulator with XRE-family HTH domain